jgi:hypothetical protein
MVAYPIVRKLAAVVLALTLVVGGGSLAMAATGMTDCGMATDAMSMQSSMTQDQPGMAMSTPLQKQHMPCKDMGGICAATCSSAANLPHHSYSPVLASAPAVPGWSLQTEFASVFSRPDIPPPITTL